MARSDYGLLNMVGSAIGSYQDRSSRLEEMDFKNKQIAEEKKDRDLQNRIRMKDAGLLQDESGGLLYDPEHEARTIRIAKAKAESDPTGLLIKQLQLQNAQLGLNEKTKEATYGKTLPAGEASGLGESTSSIKALEEYNNLLGKSPDIVGPGLLKKATRGGEKLAGLIGFEPSQAGQKMQVIGANRKQTAQVVGRFLEGGKMTDADVVRYERMLPDPGDSPSVRDQKKVALAGLIAEREKSIKASLGGAGYNVSGMPNAPAPSDIPQTKVVNGVTYRKVPGGWQAD